MNVPSVIWLKLTVALAALCSRIGIMREGRMLCVGSPQHLRSKYGNAYMVEVKLRNEGAVEEV